jgi:hypothetical protein
MKIIERKEMKDMYPSQIHDGVSCEATGYEVLFEGDSTWWVEFVDCDGEFHYGR